MERGAKPLPAGRASGRVFVIGAQIQMQFNFRAFHRRTKNSQPSRGPTWTSSWPSSSLAATGVPFTNRTMIDSNCNTYQVVLTFES